MRKLIIATAIASTFAVGSASAFDIRMTVQDNFPGTAYNETGVSQETTSSVTAQGKPRFSAAQGFAASDTNDRQVPSFIQTR
ncbi:hypothetical protein [Nitratireductor basaltis]|nr:hypothetical protein [Nitratireductor basaltis]